MPGRRLEPGRSLAEGVSASREVVIWRSAMLLPSETFVRNQGAALTRWRPRYVGAFRVASGLNDAADVITFGDTARDRLAFLRLRLTGRSPRLAGVLTRLRPALVHAHFGPDGWLVSAEARRLGLPLVVTLHGYDVTRLPHTPGPRGVRYRRNLRTAFQRAALVLAVSDFIARTAVDLGADPAKVRVHHTGVPLPAPPGATPKRWDVAFVGRFVEKKGVDDLVEALAMVGEPRPRAVFVGTGPLEEPLRERASRLGLDATFLGALEPAAVGRCLAESHVFAAPSKTAANGETEGLPTTILEAASLGLPVVATHHSGIPEAVRHERTGLLAPEGDRAALAANIRRLLADADLRARFGGEGRRHVEAHFDLAKQTRVLEDMYEGVVAATRPPAK
jgi:glycosyltransferase involved in cell wall biosynthesis